MTTPQLTWSSERTLRIAFAENTDETVHRTVRAAYEALRTSQLPAILDLTPAYDTLQVTIDPLAHNPTALERSIASLLSEAVAPDHPIPPARTVTIPVCYDPEFGPDLESVASHNNLSIEQVVSGHTSAEYSVHFLGFSPGFAYLGGLARELWTPRLDTPRTRIPAGSVGIAGSQTGVYPQSTPGGWRLIGRTPFVLFDPLRDPPALLGVGDTVRFRAIARDEYESHLREQQRTT